MPEPVKKSLVIFIYCALTVSILLVYSQVRNFDFINCDDNVYVYDNSHVLKGLAPDSIVWAFTTGYADYWHPLTWLSLMLDCQLFGPSSGWMHFVNVLFHIANALLLFTILKEMTGSLWPSAFVAAAFALHPMHVESVAWVTERKDVLSMFFGMLALLVYFRYVRHPGAARYVLSLVLFAASLMAKPMLVTLPFLLILLDYWPLNRFAPDNIAKPDSKVSKTQSVSEKHSSVRLIIAEKIPFLVLSVVSSVITFMIVQSFGGIVEANVLSLKSRAANACAAYVTYIGRMFRPQELGLFYPFDISKLTFWQTALCALLLAGISAFAIGLGRKYKYLPVGWFWFVITLIPVIGLVQAGEQSMADRFTYIPYIGLFIMIAWGLSDCVSRQPKLRIVLGIAMVIGLTELAIVSWRQASYWKNSTTLFSHVLEVTENNYVAHYCLANDLLKNGKFPAAAKQYAKTLEIRPKWTMAIEGLGRALEAQGNTAEAIEYFQKALRLKPNSASAHNNLGLAFVKQDKLAEAIGQFTQAAQISPDWPEPMNNVALLMATAGDIKNRDPNQAIAYARRACELTNYRNPAYLGTLAAAYASAGRFSKAIDTAQRAIKVAEETNQTKIKNIIERHLSFYIQGKAYIESPAGK